MTIATPRRPRIAISLRVLMLLILGFGLVLGRQVNQARQQRRALDAVAAHGGWVHFEHEFVDDHRAPRKEPPAPAWLRRALGDEYFRSIRTASFAYEMVGENLSLNANTEPCDDVLAALAGQSGLREISLHGTQATDQGLAHLRGLAALEVLNVWDAVLVTDAGVANLRGLANLKVLILEKSRITDEGFGHLAGLKKVEGLNLTDHSFGDRGLATVARMPELTWLSVGGSQENIAAITDEGLGPVVGLVQLQKLDLSHSSRVTDAGLCHLAGLKNLTRLNLAGCEGITDAGLVHLSGLENLEWLTLWGTKVAGEGLTHLEGLKKLINIMLPEGVPRETKDRFQKKTASSRLFGLL